MFEGISLSNLNVNFWNKRSENYWRNSRSDFLGSFEKLHKNGIIVLLYFIFGYFRQRFFIGFQNTSIFRICINLYHCFQIFKCSFSDLNPHTTCLWQPLCLKAIYFKWGKVCSTQHQVLKSSPKNQINQMSCLQKISKLQNVFFMLIDLYTAILIPKH